MKNLNAEKGCTINDLELSLIALKATLMKLSIEHPDKVFRIAKGKPNETQVSYSDMIGVVESLQNNLASKGCFSFGVCKTCGHFKRCLGSTEYYGCCSLDTKIRHEYESCSKHTKEGGGYGL